MNYKLTLVVFCMFLTAVFGCTKKTSSTATSSGETNITIGVVGETMSFDKTELTVPAGQEITLTFINNSTTLEHNWLLVSPGKENELGIEGIKAGRDKGFIPSSPDVLAHTKLLAPKATEVIKFKAPPPGDYPYICTNAGHHTIMKGVLHSK